MPICLALAVRNHGRLSTFDRSIPLKAIDGAEPGSLVLIGSARDGGHGIIPLTARAIAATFRERTSGPGGGTFRKRRFLSRTTGPNGGSMGLDDNQPSSRCFHVRYLPGQRRLRTDSEDAPTGQLKSDVYRKIGNAILSASGAASPDLGYGNR